MHHLGKKVKEIEAAISISFAAMIKTRPVKELSRAMSEGRKRGRFYFFVEVRGQVYTSNKMPCLNTFIKKKNLEIPLRHALSVFSRKDRFVRSVDLTPI